MEEIRHKEELEAFIKKIFDSDWEISISIKKIEIWIQPEKDIYPHSDSTDFRKVWLRLSRHQLRWDDWTVKHDPCDMKQNTHGFCPTADEYFHYRELIFKEFEAAKERNVNKIFSEILTMLKDGKLYFRHEKDRVSDTDIITVFKDCIMSVQIWQPASDAYGISIFGSSGYVTGFFEGNVLIRIIKDYLSGTLGTYPEIDQTGGSGGGELNFGRVGVD
jgi:hypothetical protein